MIEGLVSIIMPSYNAARFIGESKFCVVTDIFPLGIADCR